MNTVGKNSNLTQPEYGRKWNALTPHDPPLLYNMDVDPGEQYNVADEYPEVVEEMRALKEAHEETVELVVNQLECRNEKEEDYLWDPDGTIRGWGD